MTKNKVIMNSDQQKNKIPDRWKIEKLGDICKFKQGVQVDLNLQVNKEQKGYFKFLRIENYTQESKDFRYIPQNKIKDSQVDSKDIIVVRYGATAGFISRGLTGVLANNLFILRPINKKYIDNDFLYIILKHEKTFFYLQSAMAGGAMPALSFSMLNPMKFNFPPLPEQKRIVGVLEVWDLAVETLERKIVVKENIKKGLMQQLLTGKKRLPGFSGVWAEERLGNISDVYQPKTISKIDMLEGGKYKVFGANGVIGYHDEYNHKNSEIAITCRGATCGTVNFTEPESWITGNAMVVSPLKDSDLNKQFLFYYLNFVNLDNIITGMAQPQITGKDLKPFKIKLPNLSEQKAIAEVLTTADEEIGVLRKKLNKLKDQKKFLLNNLVTGQIRINS